MIEVDEVEQKQSNDHLQTASTRIRRSIAAPDRSEAEIAIAAATCGSIYLTVLQTGKVARCKTRLGRK